MYLFKNNIVLASYHNNRDKMVQIIEPNIDCDFAVVIYEQPRTKIFADESIYNNIFPSVITKTTLPQVWEKKEIKDGKEYLYHFNGVFTFGGVLKAGSKTFHGFGANYDGTWYSDNWEYGNVKFTPEGTHDIVCGIFKGNAQIDINDFYLLEHFGDKFKDAKIPYQPQTYSCSTNYNCNWVTNVYNPFNATRQAAQDVKEGKRNAEVKASNAQYYKDHPVINKATDNTVLTFCPICNGTGKVIDKVVTDTRFETTHYKTCPHCNGSGR